MNVTAIPTISYMEMRSFKSIYPKKATMIGFELIMTVALANEISRRALTADMLAQNPKIPRSKTGNRASFSTLRQSIFLFFLLKYQNKIMY